MTNYLLGKGERLIRETVGSSGGGPKEAVYTFAEARTRLGPMVGAVAQNIAALPAEACPGDEAVAALTLNPEYLAKSFFPTELLKAVGLTPVGSRPRRITPAKRSRGREPEEALTTQYFVMGQQRIQGLGFGLTGMEREGECRQGPDGDRGDPRADG